MRVVTIIEREEGNCEIVCAGIEIDSEMIIFIQGLLDSLIKNVVKDKDVN